MDSLCILHTAETRGSSREMPGPIVVTHGGLLPRGHSVMPSQAGLIAGGPGICWALTGTLPRMQPLGGGGAPGQGTEKRWGHVALAFWVHLLYFDRFLGWGSHQGPSSQSPCLGKSSCHMLSLHASPPLKRYNSWLGPLPEALAVLGLSSWPLLVPWGSLENASLPKVLGPSLHPRASSDHSILL